MNRVIRWLAPLGLLIFLFGLAGPASAQKVGNPGTFNFKVDSGLMKVKTQEFAFDSSQNINFNGTIDKNGNINIPTMTFPDYPISASGFNLTVKINVVGPTTGTINPLTGDVSLRLKVWIKIDGVPLGGGCRIASAGSPVDVNTMITGTSGSGGNQRTGVPYNLATGQVKLVNATFGVPGSSDCGVAAGTVDSTVGLPSPAGNNAAEFNITTTPKVTRGINPALTASPAVGTAPFTTTLNAGASTIAAPPASYRWDFTNDGTIDQITSVPTVAHTYTVGGTPTARVVIFDADSDSAETTTPLTVNAYPDLSLTAAHNDPFRVGNTESYRINLQNQGYAATSGPVNVTSTLPAGLTYSSVTGSGWSCSASGQDLTCSRPTSVGIGQSTPELGVNVTIGTAARPSVNPVFTVATAGDNGPGNNSAADPTNVRATDLKLNLGHTVHAMVVGADPANVITLSAENIGDSATVGPTVIEDDLPVGLTPVSASGAGWSCAISGQNVTCTHAGAIAPGTGTANIDLNVSGVLDPGVLGLTVNNQATVSTADDVNSGNDTLTDPTLILDGQDLGLSKTHAANFTAGQQGGYTISVRNFGTAATTGPSTVTDVLPAGLTYVSADGGPDWNCSESLGTVTCTHNDPIAAGATAAPIDLQVAVGVAAIPAVTNTASVSTPDDPNPANDSAADPTTVQAIDLTVVKTHTGVVKVGREQVYNLAVKNEGDSPTVGVSTVTDVLPAGLTYVSADGGPDWNCSESLGTVTCDHAGVLAAGQSAANLELTVAVGLAAAPVVTNSATVATTNDFNPSNNGDSDTADVIEADTAVTIARTGSFRPGNSGTYQVTVRNEGAVPTAASTEVTVTLAPGLTYAGTIAAGWACSESAGVVTCSRPAGLAGDTTAAPIMIKVMVGTGAVPSATTPVVATTAGDRNPANDNASDTATVVTPDLNITTGSDPNFRVGDTGVIRLDVSNAGSGATTGLITVTDSLPAGIDPLAAHGEGWTCKIVSGVYCEHYAALAPGADAGQIVVEARATAGALNPGETSATVSHTAEVQTGQDLNPADNTRTADLNLIAVDADLSMTGPAQIAVGATAIWDLTVRNSGAASTDGRIRVSNNLPAGFVPRNSGGSGWLCASAGLVVNCDYSQPTSPGEQLPALAIRARAGAAALGSVTNHATVNAAGDVIPGNDSDTASSTVVAAPDLSLALAARADTVRVGAEAGFEMRIRNEGTASTASPATVTISLPAGAEFVGLDHGQGWSCADPGSGSVACEHPDPIDPGQISAAGFNLRFASTTAATAQVGAVVANSADQNPANDQAAAVLTVNRINLSLTRSQQGEWTRAGTGSYSLLVTNGGTVASDGPVVITETLPAGTTLSQATGSGWSCVVSGRVMRCSSLAIIPPGGTSQLDVVLDIARVAPSPINARSTVSTDGEVDTGNDSASAQIVLAEPVAPAPGQAKVKAGKVRTTSGGVVTVWMRCPTTAAGKCRGILSLKTAGKVKVKKTGRKFRKAKLKLGSAPYALAPGQFAPVQVQVSKKGRKALKLNRKIAVKATATGEGVAPTTARIEIRRGR